MRSFIKTILMIMLTGMTLGAAAQDIDDNCTEDSIAVLTGTEDIQMPQYKGGMEAMRSFLSSNVSYPRLAAQYEVEGRVVMSFVVDTDGSLKNITAEDCKIERFNTTKFSQEVPARQIELKREFALMFAKEGARVIRKMPKWIPGNKDGVPVKVRYHLPIVFRFPDK